MRLFKHILLFFITLIQTVCGWYVIIFFSKGDFESWGSLFGCFMILIPLCAASLALRGEWIMGWTLGIPEFLLSPFAIVRHLVGTVGYIASNTTYAVEFTYEKDWMDLSDPLDKVTKFLFGFYFDGSYRITKLRNIITQLFLVLPVSALQCALVWAAIFGLLGAFDPFTTLFLFMGNTLITYLLCEIRGQESSVSYYSGDYTFRNRHTGKKRTFHTDDRNSYYELSDSAREVGWEVESSGYGSYFTSWYLFTWFLAPVHFFTQLIGFLFALIAGPRTHILSSYAKLDYEDFSLPFFQRILHFFFNFVIC